MAYRKDGRAMPNDLIFIRHGESEANVVQRAESIGDLHDCHDEVSFRPDWQQRLTTKGAEQARLVGEWLKSEAGGIDSFDGKFVSPFLRARETAGHIGGSGWIVDDRLIERFRGVYGVVSYNKALNQAELANMRDASPWYARIDGSESLQDVFGRYRSFQSSIRRHHGGQKVVVVAHGDLIKTARYSIEWLMPERWLEMSSNSEMQLPNGGVVHYSRVNPNNPTDIRPSINWIRIVYPESPEDSPNGGRWTELNVKRQYSSKELLESVEVVDRII